MGTPKLPVVFDPRTEKFYYDLPLGDIKSITANPSGTSAGVTSIGGQSGAVTLADINLGNVSNTSDVNKPVSTAQQTAEIHHQALPKLNCSKGCPGQGSQHDTST